MYENLLNLIWYITYDEKPINSLGFGRNPWALNHWMNSNNKVLDFFNTHYMDEADMYSDEIAIINKGKIVKLGTAEELKHSLGGEVILFSLGNAGIKEEISQGIREMNFVKDVIMNGSELSVLVENAEMALPHVMELLRSDNVAVEKISITKPTLDDVFLKYAGTRLETTGRISEVTQIRRMVKKG